MSKDNVEIVMEQIEQMCDVLGYPIDINRPFVLDEMSLPRVSIFDGAESTVIENDPATWDSQVRIEPIIEVLFEEDDPSQLSQKMRQIWRIFRKAIVKEDFSEHLVSGSSMSYDKAGLIINEKPGISGFSVTLSLLIEM